MRRRREGTGPGRRLGGAVSRAGPARPARPARLAGLVGLAALTGLAGLGGCAVEGDLPRLGAAEAPSPAPSLVVPGPTASPGAPTPRATPPRTRPATKAPQGPLSTQHAEYAVPSPAPLTGRLHSADVLVTSSEPLSRRLIAKVRGISGVEAVLPISVAASSVEGRTLTVAAVDPAAFRRYTPDEAARTAGVWKRVAAGQVAVDTDVPRKLIRRDDTLRLGTRQDAPRVPVGAIAPLVNRVDVVLNDRRGEQLGLPEHNALLVSTGQFTPSALRDTFRTVLGGKATMQILALEFDLSAVQTAVLTGTTVSEAVGTFSYTSRARGEISPDPAWVSAHIRTEEVPILGRVTCNKAFLPQLRAALQEVVDRGLAHTINREEYAGCYYPRYIGRDPSNGLSLHSWGIAVDLNVPGNLRGTVGEIDREVVAIFKRWGMAWGGDWRYTDPMHFEMNAVVRPR